MAAAALLASRCLIQTSPPPPSPAPEAGRFLHTGGAPSVAAIGAAGRSAPGEEAPGEAAFLKAADKAMGDLGTSGDAPFGGEVQLDPESQVGAGWMAGWLQWVEAGMLGWCSRAGACGQAAPVRSCWCSAGWWACACAWSLGRRRPWPPFAPLQVYWWHDKYRPRRPKYFNRVHTGCAQAAGCCCARPPAGCCCAWLRYSGCCQGGPTCVCWPAMMRCNWPPLRLQQALISPLAPSLPCSYEWNKYNQTHYDGDNPPPKTVQVGAGWVDAHGSWCRVGGCRGGKMRQVLVGAGAGRGAALPARAGASQAAARSCQQGYKFNIFYPELIDKTVAPTYKVDKDPTCNDGACVLNLLACASDSDV